MAVVVLGAVLGADRIAALPSGAQVVAGAAAVNDAPGELTISQTSPRAIITWKDFSIGAGESLRFAQPDAASATLNRVISDQPSSLLGAMQANGRVYLINPNGIVMGKDARIDVAGFLASTLDVGDDAFLHGGDLRLSGNSRGAVRNFGTIAALGDVFLIGREVENTGTIEAKNGKAGLAAGSEVLLATAGDERVFVQASSQSGVILNSGSIRAAAAELKAAGGNAYALAINNTGLVRATGTAERKGQIWLVASGSGAVAESGTLDGSSADGPGGRITVTGGHVLLDDGARLDASGATQGGQVRVGGGWQGQDTDVTNASAVVMKSAATIEVSAKQAGAGGTAVLWSQDYTDFSGAIAARGVTAGGDVETSSHGTLQALGTVDGRASSGASGHWLLDPRDVTIAATGASGTTFNDTFTPTADSVILASSVANALNGGNSVTITTGSTGASPGDINVNEPVSWSTNATLTLSAADNVRVNANLTATGDTAGLVLTPNATGGSLGTFSINNRATITLSGTNPSLTIAGQSYTIINHLGVEGDATTAPATPTLQGLAAAANLGGRYALGSDLDASATSGWNGGNGFTPIGTSGAPFTGTFDGLGHAVSTLSISLPFSSNVGLFGYVGTVGSISHTQVTDASILGKSSIGGLVGYNAGSVHTSFTSGTVSGPGGHLFTSDTIGGLVGTNGNVIDTSYSSASVSGTDKVGGLVGLNDEGALQNVYATGDVSGATNVGGLVGYNQSHREAVATIEDTYATGAVNGNTNVGGLIGENDNGDIIRGYATGAVTGISAVGGLVGENLLNDIYGQGVVSSYWNTQTTGQSTAVGSEDGQTQFTFGRTSAEMLAMASFPDFNITATGGVNGATWRIYEGNTTPWLSCFLFPVTLTANSDAKTYNGAAYAGNNGLTYSLSSLNPALSGTLTYGGTAQGAVNAGNYTITLSGLYSVQQGYDVIYAPGTLTINKADLTLTGTRIYDGTTLFAGNKLTATGVNGETFAVTGAGASSNLSSKDVQTSQPLATISGLTLGSSSNGGLAGNYNTVSVSNSSVSVTPAVILLTGARVYDGTTIFAGGNLTATGINSETFTVTGAGAAGNLGTKDVQSDVALSSVNGLALGTSSNGGIAADYTLSAGNSKVSVTPANITLTGTRVYDGTTIFAGANLTATGVNGETFSVTGAGASSNLGSKDVQSSQPLATVSGLTLGASSNGGLASNYSALSVADSSVSITPAKLMVTGTRVYDGSTIFGGGDLTATGVNGESFALNGAGGTGNLSSKDVQTAQTLASLSGLALGTGNSGAAVASNYHALSTANSSVSVTPAEITISTSDVVKIYDGTTTALGSPVILSGQLYGSDALGSSGLGPSYAYVGKDVGLGNKTVTIAGVGVNDGNNGHDYHVQLVPNTTSTINPADLSLTGTRVYDGSTMFAGTDLTATGISGESFTVTGSGAAGNLGSKNVQTAQTLASVSGLAIGAGNSGAALASNYHALSTVNSSVSVTPRALTITGFAANDKAYDNTATAPVATPGVLSGVVPGDAVGFTYATATFDTKDVGTGKIVTLNGVTLTGSGDQSNYTYTTTTTDLATITPATLTYTADLVQRLYGGANPTFTGTVTGFVPGETLATATSGAAAFTSSATSADGVGQYGVLGAGLTANHGNYVFVQAASNATALTINPAPLTITADSKSRAAGVANPPLTATYTGFVNGETSAVVSGLSLATTATPASPAGSYPIAASGASATNYTISFVNGVLAVNQNLLTITADDKTKTYGTPLPTFTATFDGFINGDTSNIVTGLQFSTTATAGSNVGTYAITPFGATASGYSLAYVPGTLTINPALLTITADNKSRAFGVANPALTASYSGLVNGDTAAVVSGLTVATSADLASPAGNYPITAAGAHATNYTIAFVDGTLVVSHNLLTIAADDKSKTYGTPLPEFTATFSGLLDGDTPALVSGLQFNTTATVGSNVGTYAITPFGANAPNYEINYVPGVLTINPALLTITALDATRSYGALNPAFTASYAGIVKGDTAGVVSGLRFTTPATSASGVGTYAITPGGASATNYTLSYVPGVLTIDPAALTITADNATRDYGSANPPFTASFDGLVNGDTESIVNGLAFMTPATRSSGVGTYGITPGGASANNYLISYVPGTLTINPVALTITANDATRAFGASNPTFTAKFTGLVNGDTAGVVSGLGFTTPATPSSLVGDYGITPSGAVASNYTVAYQDGTLHVTAPTVDSGVGATPVVTINDQPVITSDLAVVMIGDHRTLVSVAEGASGMSPSESLDGQVTVELGKVTNPPDTNGLTGPRAPSDNGHLVSGSNFGQFQYVASMAGASDGIAASGSGLTPAQLTDPGLYRETSVNMGAYKIIYHEALIEAERQSADNTAQGSSYREFPPTELPRVDIVHGGSPSGTGKDAEDSGTNRGNGGAQ